MPKTSIAFKFGKCSISPENVPFIESDMTNLSNYFL